MPVYTIVFRKRAAKEYIEAVAWYKNHSNQAAENFVSIVDTTLNSVIRNPYSYRNSYKNFHEIKTKKYPFSIVYFIDEFKGRIVITTLFHIRDIRQRSIDNHYETLGKK